MFAFFEGLSNVYILSTATVFLAVIIALYCANFIKDENGKHSAPSAQMAVDEIDDDGSGADSDSDTEISDGIVRHIKSARIKELESTLTEDQLEEEKRVEREQLAAIFELLKRQEAELNMKEIDESELSAQMSLYR